ncbi:hypothetical protein TcWFU_005468 [Taenia crassiceps]|uniref:EGF-like domain-containing protein n=1 Tax=Taenia crassiceps TaxID=6207 RepID=A0ABR4QRJ6_9CEST
MGNLSSWWTAIFIFAVCLFLTESHVLVTECPNGTRNCSHGRCIRHTGYDEEGNIVNEEQCICYPNYYGKACTLLLISEFSHPKIVSPIDVTYLSLDEPDFYEDIESMNNDPTHRLVK